MNNSNNDDGHFLEQTELTTLPEIKPQGQQEQRTSKLQTKPYPKHVFFIIGNEFCERFSFYGMRTVLVLYARNFLMLDDDTSTAVFHAFTVLAYFTTLFGGILADSYLGKYKTIAYLSVVYAFGHVFKTVAAIPYIPSRAAHLAMSVIGLLLIAFGTGGIKPCVSSFGGDQFSVDQVRYRAQFFSLLYWSINLGALTSKWLTPMFRADLDCYPGENDPQFRECFSVAFGVPGLLMIISLVLFVAGTRYYTVVKPEGSIFWKFCKCVWSACRNRWKRRNQPKSASEKRHWIYYADASEKMKRDSIAVLRVLFLYLPLPFFFALFDQQGSRWTLQALQLNGYWGNYLVKPDQIDVLNPLLVVSLIPFFEVTLYPLLRHLKINFSPLRRMTVGLILAGVSFICAAILQFEIDNRLTILPTINQFSVRITNLYPCNIHLSSNSSHFNGVNLNPNAIHDKKSELFYLEETLSITYQTCNGNLIKTEVEKKGGHVTVIVLKEHQDLQLFVPKKKFENGSAAVSFINVDIRENVSIQTRSFAQEVALGEQLHYKAINRGKTSYTITLGQNATRGFSYNGTIETEAGGAYSVMVVHDLNGIKVVKFNNESRQLLDVNPNTINIAWMIPQFFIITVGEVFLSITGLEFSYTQAPENMRSVLTSFWFLVVSMGSAIVLLVAKTKAIDRQSHEFLLFAGLIAIAAIVFIEFARRYKATNFDELEEECDDVEDKLVAETNQQDCQVLHNKNIN